ncbi:hypothetical protein scyTo_0004300 [Scyliorhinus torazame]|uniref:Cilia- and flagella-associated protein 45 n=1 Tax=Scyliorhinus torazame TaxID=75743 RepID=A0A401NPG4_SCYTO|nr:hypothetical protein [Scyliorhinus torazame]
MPFHLCCLLLLELVDPLHKSGLLRQILLQAVITDKVGSQCKDIILTALCTVHHEIQLPHSLVKDALRAKRSQEATEREWRRKELEDERKKAEVTAMLMKSRTDQIRQKQHFLAVQATKERLEFERVLK